jgi:DNA polymerase I-like protein with 3'-5' exonuclease and polymerase domains
MLKLLVESDMRSWEDKDSGTEFGGKVGWWLKKNWLENAGVGSDEAKLKYTYPQLVGKYPRVQKATKKNPNPAPAPSPAMGIWDAVDREVPLLAIADLTAKRYLGVDSVANWHGSIDERDGRLIGVTLPPSSVMKQPNLLPLVIRETANLLEAAKDRSVLKRPEVVKGIAPYLPEKPEAVVDLEWQYDRKTKQSGKLTVVGVSYEEGKSYATYDVGQGTDNVRALFEAGVRVIGHNFIDADLPKLRELGISGPRSYHPKHLIDTMIVAHLIHPHWSGMGLFGLEDLVRFYRPTTAWKEDKSDLLYYNGLDTAYNFRLWKDLEIDLNITNQWHLVEKDQRLAQMAHLMRVRGMRVDSDGLRQFKAKWLDARREIAEGFKFSPTSWQQIQKYFNANGVRVQKTGYDVLVKLLRRVSKYAQAMTRVNSNGDIELEPGFDVTQMKPIHQELFQLIMFKDEGKGIDAWFDSATIERGRVHPKFNVTGTAVARFSSSDPNYQNVPPDYRRFILAQNDDEFLASYDGKNIEGRTVARQANATQLLADYASGLDIHRLTSSRIIGKAMADVTDDERQAGKKTVHATNYVETAPSLAGRVYGNVSHDSIRKAQKLQDGYFNAYPEVRDWHDRLRHQMSQGDLQLVNSFGRVRMIYAQDDHERVKRASHYLGCSDGADVVNQRALDVWDQFGLIPQSIVHDELLYSLPKGERGEKTAKEIRELLDSPITQMDGFVIPFGYKHGDNYGKYKKGKNADGLFEEE